MDLSAEKVMFRGRSYPLVDFVGGQEIISFDRQDDSVTIQTTQYEYTVADDKVYKRVLSAGFGNPAEEIDYPLDQNKNKSNKQILKGGNTMKYQDDKGRTRDLPDRVVKAFPESMRDLEIITDTEVQAIIQDPSVDPKTQKVISTAFAKLKQVMDKEAMTDESENNPPDSVQEPVDGKISEPEPPGGDLPGNSGLGTSNIFNQGGGNTTTRRNASRGPKTEEEKAAAKAARDAKVAEHQATRQTMQAQVQTANSVLAQNPQLVETVENLRKILTNPYGGVIGLAEVVCTTNTRIKGKAINTVRPEERVYHPNIAAQQDKTKTGKDIESKLALGKYDVTLIESNPGAVVGVIMYVPSGITVDHLSGLTNVLHQKNIADLASAQAHDMVPLAVNKYVFTTLLSLLMTPAYFLTPNKMKDVTRPYYFAEPHPADNGLYWYSLKAVDRFNKVTKLACEGYLPLSTYNTAKLAQSDQKALTQLIFGKLLTNNSNFTHANKFTQLSDASRAMFTGTVENFEYTGFKDTNSVKAYTSTKSNPKKSTLPLPATQMSKASSDKPSTPQFVKSRYGEPGYSGFYASRIQVFKDVLSSFKRQSGSSQRLEELRKTANLVTLSGYASGQSVLTQKPI